MNGSPEIAGSNRCVCILEYISMKKYILFHTLFSVEYKFMTLVIVGSLFFVRGKE